MTQPRIAIVGAGGVGTFLAASLLDAGHEVVVCARRPLDELSVERDGRLRAWPITAITSPSDAVAVDWILLATKAQDTAGTAAWLAALATERSTVVVVQNGIGHVDRVAPLAPGAVILPALAFLTIEPLGRGRVRHLVGRRVVVPAGEAADRLARLLGDTELEVAPVDDFLTESWRKLLGNLVANPLTALTDRTIEVLRDEPVTRLAERLLGEAVAVGSAAGAALGASDVRATLAAFDAVSGANGTSMLFDRRAGRRLEHEALTGALVAAGRRHGVPTPANDVVLALLEGLDGR